MNFIQDEQVLENFIHGYLPELIEDECFMLALFARKKYLPEDSSVDLNGITLLRREFVTKRSSLVKKIREFELSQNIYSDKQGHSIPESCMVLYLMPNPRSNRKAAANASKRITDKLLSGDDFRLMSIVRTELHRAFSRKIYLDFDVDIKPPDDLRTVLERIYEFLGESERVTVFTKNGAHVLVKRDAIDLEVKNSFYQGIQKFAESMSGEIEIRNDALLPIPGCYQGGFIPKFGK